jgi:gamma-glutamyltranspeptidase/glutathione hydrolase
MIETARGQRGMVTAPHHLASQAGLAVLRDGGNAVEAMVAAAATIAVVYPHMNAIGGDGFWLIAEPGAAPIAVEACGPAAAAATPALYRERGLTEIPARGGLAANTVAGAVGGWQVALEHAARWGKALPRARLLDDAIHYARNGIAVTASQRRYTQTKWDELEGQPGFRATFAPTGSAPETGSRLANPALAATLERLAAAGFDDFYRGDLARALAADLAHAGSPLALDDLARYRARIVTPLQLNLPCGTLWNLPPPTQGLASLMILGIFARLDVAEADGFAHVHGLVEATKRAFAVRDRHIADPAVMTVDPASFLSGVVLAEEAAAINPRRAAPWGTRPAAGDTVWLGAIDGAGRAVSFIQSLYWEFGSGVVGRDTGVLWQNRGASFKLEPGATNALAPGRRPFHTLNPAYARLKDGRQLVYGTMGGDGQPQTQAAVFTRYALFGQALQQAVSAPRWLLGRTWGSPSITLKLEQRWPERLVAALVAAGHPIEMVDAFSDLAGHAGAVAQLSSGIFEGAADPRSDGAVAGF